MTDAMKRFLELDQMMENEIKARALDKTKIENEVRRQKEGMWAKMRSDLRELRQLVEGLGIGYIETGVSLHMQNFPLKTNEGSMLVFDWYNDTGMLSEIIWRNDNPHSVSRYAVCNSVQTPPVEKILTLYGHWDEIMRGAEQGIMRKVIDKRRKQTAALENEIEKLSRIKTELEDLE